MNKFLISIKNVKKKIDLACMLTWYHTIAKIQRRIMKTMQMNIWEIF